ncbi:thyroid adenoma-associated protein homolog isoform X1 [Pangasianodon hypophthalmus]|uniref:thyroid adenoma-associated protein homolog isoform X1 n=1 Tax=Pangasianodon hypophthalmus TaxID=310915 RepID=UPI002307446D|nr:thyroid adenoma-associated protein homolog isoform X1 [Pangasianodon hypophthalmus]
MISAVLDEPQVGTLLSSFVLEDDIRQDVKDKLQLFLERLTESARSTTKRVKERSLEEALQMLRKISPPLLQSLKSEHHRHLIQLLLASQLDAVNTSTSACRKLDQMLQHLAQVSESLVFEEFQQCLHRLLHQEQVLSLKDLQIVCMFLEESMMGREGLRLVFPSLLCKITTLLPDIMKEEATRNGALCYQTVKLCLQMFQLLPEQVVPLVFSEQKDKLHMREILGFLMNIIVGEICNRDTRLLAGTAMAMLISIAPDSESGNSSALSLLQVTSMEKCSLAVGQLQVDCIPRGCDGVDRLSVARGLLTCLRKNILVRQNTGKQTCLLLDGLFPLVSDLLREKLDCHYYVFQVFILWLKSVKECLPEIREISGAPFLEEGSNLRDKLTQIIWDNAESPVEGVSESVRTAFSLFLEIYELDCQLSGDTEKRLYVNLLRRIAELPWESRAKYSPLSALLPYVGTNKVLEQYPALPSHIYKCLSTNHLAPCASEIYKLLLQEQRRELTVSTVKDAPPTELHMATQWARRWQPTVLKSLTSDVTLLQNNASSYLLPCTLRCFPEAFDTLLAALDPAAPGHLRAWVCIMSAQRANSGRLSWISESNFALETLQLALSSLDDSVRLAAFSLICCSPKSKEPPLEVEYAAVKDFLPFNLNSESSPFRQHLQAGVRKFLVRIRDSCMASLKGQKSKRGLSKEEEKELEQGVDFIDWLAQLPLVSLAPGNSFQRKKTALLLLAAILETCSDSWSPDRKKGQPPANMSELINFARERGKWDFYCRARQLVLIGCLEDVTNEIREHAAELLVRFFPQSLESDVAAALFSRAQRRLHSPRVQEAQMGALMIKLLFQKCVSLDDVLSEALKQDDVQSVRLIRHLLKSLEQQYLIAKQDMLLAARSSPLHGAVSAVHKCVLDVPGVLTEALDHSMIAETLSLLEKITLLLLGVLYGDQNMEDKEVPPSFCDMGNAISSLIGHNGSELDEDGEENVLLSEEHSLVLTCCWVTLKEIGIFLGSLVERILSITRKDRTLLTVEDLQKASKVFKDIILKCRHWGAVEGCCIGFTKFCAALLTSSDPKLREIPNHILQQGLCVLQTPRSTSVTRRAAGLPMLILGVLAAEESSTSHPLLAHSINTLLETAAAPLPQNWDQTLDLPQVCAVHTIQALVKGSSLGLTILQYAPEITMLSLTLLSSPCWAMRNAALQLYSSLCSRMLGQRPAGEDISAQYGMSSPAFFKHYPALKPFLQEALERAATDLHEARLSLHPSLYPILTLLAKLQPGAQEQTQALSDFLSPLLQLAASPVYGVRTMSAQALVAMIPPTEYVASVLRVVEELPEKPSSPRCHNRIHGQLLQIKAILARVLHADNPRPSSLCGVVEAMEARLWLASHEQRCPLVRQAYVAVLRLLRENCSRAFLVKLGSLLMKDLHRAPHTLELGSASFHQSAVHYLCEDPDWAWQLWPNLSSENAVTRLSLVKWVKEGRGWRGSRLEHALEKALQASLREALLDQDVEYKGAYLSALVEVMTPDVLSVTQTQPLLFKLKEAELHECIQLLLEDLEGSRGGPELLSQTLGALTLLLSPSTNMAVLQRWCVLLETHRRAEAPEALRLACAQALALTGAAVVTSSLMGSTALKALSTRLISTGAHLLQDQSQQVRAQAAKFASVICKSQAGDTPPKCFLMQSSRSLRMLLDLLLGEFWDSEGTLEALVCHLPDWDLRSVLQEAKLTQCSSLYEQDNANMFLEPSVISETMLPYLLCLAKRYPESSVLAKLLDQWEQENTVSVRENLSICAKLHLGDTLDPDWLSVLMEPRFHGALCGLYAKAAFLLQMHSVSNKPRPLFDPSVLEQDLLDLHKRLSLNGVYIPDSFINAIRTERV